ncbi:hypothetical protein LY78DRAFT_260970 [Colletotrichum sublineola]|nr:hypothetical protein LY78DRAFT_260970 [Colletotrichum sublineola]
MSTRRLPCSTRRLPRSVAMGWLVRRETAISSHHFAFSAHASRASFTYKSTIFSSSPVRGQRQERRCGGREMRTTCRCHFPSPKPYRGLRPLKLANHASHHAGRHHQGMNDPLNPLLLPWLRPRFLSSFPTIPAVGLDEGSSIGGPIGNDGRFL